MPYRIEVVPDRLAIDGITCAGVIDHDARRVLISDHVSLLAQLTAAFEAGRAAERRAQAIPLVPVAERVSA